MKAVIDLQQVAQEELLSLIKQCEGYKKLQSYLALYLMGFPVLKGIIISQWSNNTHCELNRALSANGWKEVVLRSDCFYNVSKKPPGGFLYSNVEIGNRVREVLFEDRIPFLLEPASRFDDLYSGNILFESESDVMYWEIVGPGFDLSDLNRGEVGPHETFLTYKGNQVLDWRNLSPLDVPRHTWISSDQYQRSWKLRMIKVSRMAGQEWDHIKDPIQRTEVFLKTTGHTLLLEARNGYVPFGYDNLCHVYSLVADMPDKMARLGLPSERFCVAFGILLGRGLVFWDLFNPSSYLK